MIKREREGFSVFSMQVHFVPKKLQAATLNYVILNSKFAKAEFQSVFLLKLDTILIDLHQESV